MRERCGENGICESSINLSITKKVQTLLEQSGCTVLLTREDENGIYDSNANTIHEKKVSDLKNRAKLANESNADVFISIHLNKFDSPQYWGWQTFFRKNDEKSKKLAICIQDGLNHMIQKENKRQALTIDNKYLVEHVSIPIVICECGFLSNPEEAKLLQEDSYQEKLAFGIYTGILEYFFK